MRHASKLPFCCLHAVFALTLALIMSVGCGDDDEVGNNNNNNNKKSYEVSCTGTTCSVKGTVTDDLTFKAANKYLLKGGVFVGNDKDKNVTLTIEAGTTVYGDSATKSMLVIQRGSKIVAQGTKDKPIVFTSAKAEGSRARGDWGGLVINGKATSNRCLASGACNIAGEAGTGTFGGTDDADNSGVLKYVRIEFAGRLIDTKNELNGLALQGVGTGTTLDYIQIQMGQDDGIEFFGGTANVRHLVITGADDDSLDWTDGWRGKGQFIVVQQHKDAGDNGIEADNLEENHKATPRSMPTLANMTLVGSPGASTSDAGILLRRGTGAKIYNSIVTSFNDVGMDLDDAETYAAAKTNIVVSGTLFACKTNFKEKTDDPIKLSDFILKDNTGNKVVTDDGLEKPLDEAAPDFAPKSGSAAVASGQAVSISDTWFTQTSYVGAVDPANDWTKGWTYYKAN